VRFKDASVHLAAGGSRLLVVLVFCCFSCSSDHSTKNLNDHTAVPLIQTEVDSRDGGNFLVNSAGIANLIGKPSYEDFKGGQYPDPSMGGRLHRLVLAGYVNQAATEENFPDLTGEYEDSKELGFHPLSLKMQPASRNVTGQFHLRYYKNGNGSYADCSGDVTGAMNHDGTVQLQFQTTSAYYCGSRDFNGPFAIYKNGSEVTLRKADVPDDPSRIQFGWQVRGKLTGNSITIKSYTYSPSSGFSEKIDLQKQSLNIGKIKVEKSGRVLLEGVDAVAESEFQWTVELNNVGQTYLGTQTVDGHGRAIFRKQPDGNWVCGEVNVIRPNQSGI
jgi:hypothetical protein